MNMRPSIQLSIPSACRQSWSGMQTEKDGRYCGTCQKTVIDFTAMTDAELIKHFQQTTTATCGRFTADQLNRNLMLPRKPLPFLKYLVFVSLPAFLLSLKTGAQVQPVSTEMTPVKPSDSKKAASKKLKSVSGVVHNGLGIPQQGVQVGADGAKHTAITDAEGKFVLTSVLASDTIVFRYDNHYDVRMSADRMKPDSPVQMHSIQAMLGGVVVELKPKRQKANPRKKWF